MNTVSTTSGEKDPGQERRPMDLASKNTLKPGESVKAVLSTQQPILGSHARGLAGSVGHVQSRILSSGMSAVGSVPVCVATSTSQAPVKQGVTNMGDQGSGLASVVLMSVSRPGLPSNASASSGVASLSQNTSAASRPTSSPTVTATTTYHVPRGAAAVANIAAPRPGTAALGRTTSGATAITHASNLVTGLRGLVPRATSPATTWLGAVSQSSVASGTSRARAPTVTSMNSYAQSRTPTLAVTSRPTTPQGTRIQAEPLRSQTLHSTVQKLPSNQNTSTVNAASQVLVTQSRSQQSSAPTPVSVSSSSAASRVLPGTTTVTSTPVVVAASSATSSASCSASPRPVQTALLSTAPRTAVTSNVRPVNSVNATTNRSAAVTATVTGATATLALAVGTQVRPRLTTAGASRLTTTVPSPRLLTTPARPATASATTVLPTQARLGVQGPASVVSLHPVVVSTGGALPLKSAAARPTLGPKVISQSMHAPASIQITQMPVSAVQTTTKLPSSVSSALPQSPATRTVTYSASAAVVTGGGSNVRPVNVTTSALANPVTKVTLHTSSSQPAVTQPVSQSSQPTSQPQTQQTSVCIPHRASPAPTAPTTPLTVEHTGTSVLSTYNIPAYLYEPSAGGGGSTYQVTGVVARPYPATGGASATATAGATYTVQTSTAAVLRPSGGLTPTPEATPPPPPPPTVSKPSASPRPSILRKRDNEGSPMKAQKNLTPILSSLGAGSASGPPTTTGSGIVSAPPVSPPSPRRPDSRGGGGGNSSGGSTTISATSSPGLGEASEETASIAVKQEVGEEPAERPPTEMSPRKKPRKQQLTGNELHEPKFSEDEMEFISEERIKKEVKEGRLREAEETILHISIPPPEEPMEKPAVLPPARRRGLSLLAGYRHNWKSRHNHYVRYSDVRPKDERRPTVSELASQKQVLQKLEGWKVHHLSTQMEELSELEQQVSERLAGILNLMEKRMGKELEKDINRINELIKGNMQRSKVTSDQMQEAKIQVMKIFEHKNHVADIINRSGNKRSLKKREKS